MSEEKVRANHAARTDPHVVEAADYDVIVVGGRVAGASTAMLLARQGHRILVVERSPMPSDTVSTHAILRTGILQLSRWGLLDEVVEAGTPPVRRVTLGFGDERIGFEIKPDFGIDTFYAPRRHLLDHLLLRKAEEAGAVVRDGTTMKGLLRGDDGSVHGVVLGRGESQEQVTARFVIGADGHRSRVADLVDARFIRRHPATNAVNYAYYRDVDADGFWFQFTPGVNAGLIPTNDDLCLVFAARPTAQHGQFAADPDSEMVRLLKLAGSDLAEAVRAGTRGTRFYGTTGLAGFIRQAWGPGWVLVGDSGFTKDPISAHGISDGLRDAELCARAVDRALRDPSDGPAALDWYATLRDTLSHRLFEESRALAAYGWDASEASARMRVISQVTRDECDLLVSLPDWSAVPGLARV
jgi:flavin-dependent dehydrogenase